MEEQRQREHSAAVASGQIPRNFIQRPRDTVSSLLGRTAQQNHFRLDALTGEFFEPLEAMLGNKPYLLAGEKGDSPSSLDCLALGYLSLALVPDLTSTWLRDAMRAKAPLLSAYTERMRRQCFGEAPADVTHAFSPQSAPPSSLPWRAPERVSVTTIGSTLLSTLADNTPFLSEIRRNNRLSQGARSAEAGLSSEEQKAVSGYADSRKKDMYLSIATVAAGVAALIGYAVHAGFVIVVKRDNEEDEEAAAAFDRGAEAIELGMSDPGSANDFLGI